MKITKLQTKMIFLVCSSILMTAALTIHYSSTFIYKIILSEHRDRGRLVADITAEHLIPQIINRDKVLVYKGLQAQVDRHEEILYVYVTDFDGEVFLHTFAEGFPKDLSISLSDILHERDFLIRRFQGDGFLVQEVSKPLVSGMKARFFIGYSDAHIKAQIREKQKQIAIYISIISLLAIVACITLAGRIITPIIKLTEAVQNFGDMKIFSRLSISGGCEEVDRLSVAFNDMAESRNIAHSELAKHKAHLETIVEERTKKLIATNELLQGEIHERTISEQQKENLILQLQKASIEVKSLSGLLPICASCKNIRDDKGYWKQIETYIQEHSDCEFSHGLCQDCAKKLYPEIIDENGSILAEVSPWDETTFSSYLPAPDETKTDSKKTINDCKSAPKAKILIMDDEEMVRGVAKASLTQIGYEVVLATDGEEALKQYREFMNSGEFFDLVIMDLSIPEGMGGEEAVKEILKLNPKAKVIVSSGHVNDPIMSNCKDYGFCTAIGKPFQLKELYSVVSEFLK